MLYGTPTRAAGAYRQHRPPPPGTGTHVRPRAQRRAPIEPQRTAQWLAHGLAAVIVLGLVVMIGFLIVNDDGTSPPPATVAAPAEPLPSLTLQEVFPSPREITAGGSTYRVEVRHVDTDCRTAATGELGAALTRQGCGQVIRAMLTAPYAGYEVTTGVLDLADTNGTADVDSRLRELVETGDGGFAILGSDPSATATAQVGWHAVGHYLLYCVITRPDGQLVTADDPYAARITAELVDGYLSASVLGNRASSA